MCCDWYHLGMRLSDFHFDLPEELIAQSPPEVRSAGRLLEFGGSVPARDGVITDLPQRLRQGDLLVFNNTRVIRARLRGHKVETGGRVELLVERVMADGKHALCQVSSSKPVRDGALIELADGTRATVLGREPPFVRVAFSTVDLFGWLDEHGEVPLPPYIKRIPGVSDDERYQTVFASVRGAVAAPTAGLHFDDSLFEALRERGLQTAELTLHVGAGTFQPVRVENIEDHRMHPEWLTVGETLVRAVAACRASGGRVIAVGTTSVRALETAARAHGGELGAFQGDSELFLAPGERFHVVDGLITNFHLPGSTLLMLISAFAGMQAVRKAYAHAVANRYRFFSYGDACLIWPEQSN